jgi:AcrR family transcriptional regulator
MGTVERRQKEKAEMRQNILDAAMELYIAEGFESVSIRKIAEKIEYHPSTIYLYFEDKDAIMFELHNIGFMKLLEKQMSIQEVPAPLDRLFAHGRAYLEFALENPHYYDIMFILPNPAIKIANCPRWDGKDRAYDLLQKNIRECMEAGYFSTFEVDELAFMLWTQMHGIASLHIRRGTVLAEFYTDQTNNMVEYSLTMLHKFVSKLIA